MLFILIVLAMESQAEAIGQLTTDDLEGKVVIISLTFLSHSISCEFRSMIFWVKKLLEDIPAIVVSILGLSQWVPIQKNLMSIAQYPMWKFVWMYILYVCGCLS